ncbi:chromatin accessibility complex protein 1 [Rhodnius prolixus]|uniref:CBFD_NFYB_HMF domain-containing protein n=2 Tax=Rhodnius TaxID=13248 RepID=T1HCZ9_RHOPR
MSVTKKQLQLPMNRIKTIMKSSPNVETIGQEALFAVTKSAELFIRFLTEEGLKRCPSRDKLEYKGVAEVAQTNANLNFLTEILPRKLTVKECRRITEKDRERLESSDSSEESTDEGVRE